MWGGANIMLNEQIVDSNVSIFLHYVVPVVVRIIVTVSPIIILIYLVKISKQLNRIIEIMGKDVNSKINMDEFRPSKNGWHFPLSGNYLLCLTDNQGGGGHLLRWHMYSEIHQLKAIGLNKAQVARKLAIDVKTVTWYWEVPLNCFM